VTPGDYFGTYIRLMSLRGVAGGQPVRFPPELPPRTLAVGIGDLVRLPIAPDGVPDLVEVLFG